MNDSRKKFSLYDMEFYVAVQLVCHWCHYLIRNLYRIPIMKLWTYELGKDVKWSAYLQEFTFVLRHKLGIENKVASALNRQSHFLTTIFVIVLGFEEIHKEYPDDHDFGRICRRLFNGKLMNIQSLVYMMVTSFVGISYAYHPHPSASMSHESYMVAVVVDI